jgi:hypothetical protein
LLTSFPGEYSGSAGWLEYAQRRQGSSAARRKRQNWWSAAGDSRFNQRENRVFAEMRVQMSFGAEDPLMKALTAGRPIVQQFTKERR